LVILAARASIRSPAGSQKWPVAEGVVLDSLVAADREQGRQRFRPVVRYRYQVAGRQYEGSRIGWAAAEGFGKYTRARRVLDR
jgi:hypothetical protein